MMRRAALHAVMLVVLLVVLGLLSKPLPAATVGTPTREVATRSIAGSPLYGVTLDDVSDLRAIGASLRSLPGRPTARLYFDTTNQPAYYAAAVRRLRQVSNLMGELLDSSDERRLSTAAYSRRVASYLSTYRHGIALWEIGNEVNGNWTGRYPVVEAKLVTAYRQVAAARGRTALTLYYNVGCGDGPGELDPLAFSRRYVPVTVRNGIDVLLLSYYEQACRRTRPSPAVWTRYFARLHRLYPHARVGFGEIGLQSPADRARLPYAEGMIRYYYGLRIQLPYYIGGYFWWYYAEDCVPPAQRPLWRAIRDGFLRERGALSFVSRHEQDQLRLRSNLTRSHHSS